MHRNKYLLTDVLKGEMGFQGFLVSDWAAIDKLGADYKSDIEKAINAGLDMAMIPNGPGSPNNYVDFITDLKALVAEGKVPQTRIDDAARRILRVKAALGLFQNPWTDAQLTGQIGSPAHRAVARQCVQESVVLLKNESHQLPLKKDVKRLAVIGQGADDLGLQCGGWTIDWQGRTGAVTTGGTTLLAALKAAAGPQTEIVYSPDGNATGADAAIVVVSEPPYAETAGDRQDLNLSTADRATIAQLKNTGVPVVTVIYSGRPLILGSALTDSTAVMAAWLPGTEGAGLADILFGTAAPVGKLTHPWPADAGQYSVDHLQGTPQFPEGYGLTYP